MMNIEKNSQLSICFSTYINKRSYNVNLRYTRSTVTGDHTKYWMCHIWENQNKIHSKYELIDSFDAGNNAEDAIHYAKQKLIQYIKKEEQNEPTTHSNRKTTDPSKR